MGPIPEVLRRTWLRRVPFLTRLDTYIFSLLDSGSTVEAFGYKFYLDPEDTVTRKKLARYGGDELTLRKIVLSELQPGDVFLDIGAHFGYYTVPAAQRIGRDGQVIAVEADGRNISFLKKSLESNLRPAVLKRVEVIEAAVSDGVGEARLYEGHERGMFSMRDWQNSKHWTSVQTTTLDRVIGDTVVDVIKIDVEGAEPLVLEGGARTLQH